MVQKYKKLSTFLYLCTQILEKYVRKKSKSSFCTQSNGCFAYRRCAHCLV